MAKIISLASQKGGVGKSVSAVNLAYAFAIGGYKILLIDFDSQGSVRTSLGIQDSKAMGTKELLTKSHSLAKTYLAPIYCKFVVFSS